MSVVSGVIPWLWLYRRIGKIFLSFSGKRETRTKHKSRMRGGREQQREALRVRLLPTLRGRVFHLTKLNSNLKASELFRRTYFQIKVIKSGMISDLRESLRGVSRQPPIMMLGLVFYVISIFYLHRALDKIHTWSSLLMEKSLLRKNQRWKKVLGKKKRPLKKERKKKEYHSVQKRNSFVKATDTVGAPYWRQISNREVAVRPKFAI